MQAVTKNGALSRRDIGYVVAMATASVLSYEINTHLIHRFVARPDELLGGMWAVVASVFVFRSTADSSLSAGVARLLATSVSFALCLAYLLIWPFHAVGMGALIGLGALVMMLLGRRDDIVTTGITTSVVMVVAAMSPDHAWHQPILRLVDSVVGIAVGVTCAWIVGRRWTWPRRT